MQINIKDLDSKNIGHLSSEKIVSFLERNNIKEVRKIERVKGGVTHYVFHIITESDEFYLKIRSYSFAEISSVKCHPSEIRHEIKAIDIFSNILPNYIPRVVAYDEHDGLFLMTSVMSANQNLRSLLKSQNITVEGVIHLGKGIGIIHQRLALIDESIRDDDDIQVYEDLLEFRFGLPYVYDQIRNVINELKKRPRTLVFGDLWPANLGLVHNELRIIDFDMAHRGNPIADIGFLFGNIYLMRMQQEFQDSAADYIKNFLLGYRLNSNFIPTHDEDLLKRIVLCTILHRLNYVSNSADTTKRFIDKVCFILVSGQQLSWNDLEQQLLNV